MEKLREWLTDTIKSFVSYPDEVEIESREDEMGLLFIVRIHKADRGIVIGTKGNTAQALRVLLRSMGRRSDIRASMKIDIPGQPFEPNRTEE